MCFKVGNEVMFWHEQGTVKVCVLPWFDAPFKNIAGRMPVDGDGGGRWEKQEVYTIIKRHLHDLTTLHLHDHR